MASPEASEFQPVDSAELKAHPDRILDPLRDIANDPASSSADIKAALRDAVSRDIFAEDKSDSARFDDTFSDRAELSSAFRDVPEVQTTLDLMKSRMVEVTRNEKINQVWDQVGTLPTTDEKIARMSFLLEESYRRGEIDIVPGKPGKPKVPARKASSAGPATPEVPAIPPGPMLLGAKDKLQQANKEAFEIVLAFKDPATGAEFIPPAERGRFAQAVDAVGKRKGGIDTEEKARRAAVQEHLRRDQRAREEAARARVEAADRVQEQNDERAALNQREGLDLPQIIMEKHAGGVATEVTDPAELARARKRLDDATKPRSRKWVRMTDPRVHERALQENERFDQDARLGSGPIAVETAHAEAIAQRRADELAGLSAEDFNRHIDHELEMAANPTFDQRRDMVNNAHEAAIAEARTGVDTRVAAVADVREQYEARIAAEPDANIRRQLVAARDQAIEAEHTRQVGLNEQRGQFLADAMNTANDARSRSQRHEASHDVSIRPVRPETDQTVEATAQARREALLLDPVPFMEEKQGGLFHRKKNRGPKVIESYFRAQGDDHLVVLERRNRRSGELLSQTVVTTEKPIRTRNLGELPPREISAALNEAREADQQMLIDKASGRISKALGGSAGPGDYVNFQGGGFIGSGDRIEGPAGVYQNYVNRVPDAAQRGIQQRRLGRFRQGEQQRRGGFWYWLSGGRI